MVSQSVHVSINLVVDQDATFFEQRRIIFVYFGLLSLNIMLTQGDAQLMC